MSCSKCNAASFDLRKVSCDERQLLCTDCVAASNMGGMCSTEENNPAVKCHASDLGCTYQHRGSNPEQLKEHYRTCPFLVEEFRKVVLEENQSLADDMRKLGKQLEQLEARMDTHEKLTSPEKMSLMMKNEMHKMLQELNTERYVSSSDGFITAYGFEWRIHNIGEIREKSRLDKQYAVFSPVYKEPAQPNFIYRLLFKMSGDRQGSFYFQILKNDQNKDQIYEFEFRVNEEKSEESKHVKVTGDELYCFNYPSSSAVYLCLFLQEVTVKGDVLVSVNWKRM